MPTTKAAGLVTLLRFFLLAFFFSLYLAVALQMNLAHAGFTHWTSIGPEGGSVETLAIDPQAPNTLYAGGGVFKIQQITGRMDIADFDGDGATDVAAFHLPTDQFFVEGMGNLGQFGWGASDSMPLIWDYDGDGKTDVSIYHIPTNQWFVKGVGNLGQYGWGGADSIPVPGDYNGDGRMERAFYHSPTNRWFVEGQDPVTFGWNCTESIPLPGDYDGDGKTDMVIYHIPSNQWFQYGVGNLGQFGWGGTDSIPVPGDYNGDGKTEIAVYHIPTNQWFVKGMGNLGQYGWGGLESFPIPGDYNGDGVMERGFYRPGSNQWFIEGEDNFVWGWGGSDFMPITSSIAVYNWFRFNLHKFEDQCPNEGECANIAGNWSYSESATVTCTYDGETENDFLRGSGTIHINQNACNVNWRVPDFNVDRTGTVDGNYIQVSGLFAVALEEGVNITQNMYTAEGTISGNVINLNGTGSVSGNFCDGDRCYNFSCTTTDDTVRLTRSSYTSMLETMDKKKAIRKLSATFLNNSLKVFTTCGP